MTWAIWFLEWRNLKSYSLYILLSTCLCQILNWGVLSYASSFPFYFTFSWMCHILVTSSYHIVMGQIPCVSFSFPDLLQCLWRNPPGTLVQGTLNSHKTMYILWASTAPIHHGMSFILQWAWHGGGTQPHVCQMSEYSMWERDKFYLFC